LNSGPLLEIQQIGFERHDDSLFKGISLCLSAGELLQISGPNGCGKTTFLHILATLKLPSEGRILWRGNETNSCRSLYLADVAYIGHRPGMKLGLTARENLTWYCQLHSALAKHDIDGALVRAGLGYCSDIPCDSLSAGELRRVALAVLQLRQATLWLLDEPLTALDNAGVEAIEALFKGHLAEGGAVIFSSHQDITLNGVRNLSLIEHTMDKSQ
jgi:heme exporter protein A